MLLRNILIFIILVLSIISICFSQTEDIPLDDLKAPVMPAFILLDVEFSAIENPVTPEAITINMSLDFRDISLPKNYAIEFSPYYLFKSELNNLDEYYRLSFFDSLLKNLSISTATVPMETEENGEVTKSSGGTKIGIGVRTLLLDGKESKHLGELDESVGKIKADLKILSESYYKESWIKDDITRYETYIKFYGYKINDINDQLYLLELEQQRQQETNGDNKNEIYAEIASLEKERENYNNKLNNAKTKLNELKENIKPIEEEITNLDKQLKEEIDELKSSDKRRTGFITEIAGGVVIEIPKDIVSNTKIGRWGLWFTSAYQTEEPALDFLAVARFLRDENDLNPINSFDYGGKLEYQYKKFSASIELLQRIRKEAEETKIYWRSCANFDYAINNTLSVNVVFGKNFSQLNRDGDLIAQINFNIGLGQPMFKLQTLSTTEQ